MDGYVKERSPIVLVIINGGSYYPSLGHLGRAYEKLEIRGRVPTKTEDYMPSSDISALEKKWEGELKEASAK